MNVMNYYLLKCATCSPIGKFGLNLFLIESYILTVFNSSQVNN